MELRWRPSPARLALCVGTAAYAYFLIPGIPLWDDDYTSWVVNNGLLRKWVLDFVLEVLSPVSRQVESWGFQERPLQSLVYKLCYSLSGFDAWSYAVFKCAVYAALGVMIHRWGERVAGPTTSGLPMLAGAALFVLAPSVTAAHILIQDFGPAAELLFVALAWLGWHEIERTPPAWRGWPRGGRGCRRWSRSWCSCRQA